MFCAPHQALRQRSAALAEAQRSAQSAQAERAAVEERLRGLQRAVAMLETEKKDAERQAVRLEKDKNALRNTLDKVGAVPLTKKLLPLRTTQRFTSHLETHWVRPVSNPTGPHALRSHSSSDVALLLLLVFV